MPNQHKPLCEFVFYDWPHFLLAIPQYNPRCRDKGIPLSFTVISTQMILKLWSKWRIIIIIPRTMVLGAFPRPFYCSLILFWTVLQVSRSCVRNGDLKAQGSRPILWNLSLMPSRIYTNSIPVEEQRWFEKSYVCECHGNLPIFFS